MHRNISSAAVVLLLSAGAASAGPGSAFIQQIATPGLARSGQVVALPQANMSTLDVRRADGALIGGLRNRFGQAGGLELNQRGEFHVANISQQGEAGNIASVEQDGTQNSVALLQSGSVNAAVLSQFGSGNSIHGTQSGDANYANISQRSEGNAVHFTQSGTGNVLTVVQD